MLTELLGFGLFSSSGILGIRRFGNWICFRLQVRKKDTQLGPLKRANLNPKRRVFYYLEFRTIEEVQKPSNSVCHPPSSEPFRIYKKCSRNLFVFSLLSLF
jgi:hypothetical protein